MSVSKFFQGVGLTALAAAMAVTAVPTSAQDRGPGYGRNRGGEQTTQAPAGRQQRAAQIDRRSERQAAQIDRRSEQRANRIERQGNWRQSRQIDRSSEQAARQVERRGDYRATQVERQGDQAARRVERNRTYVDRNRNTSYATRSTAGRDYRRDGNRDGNWSNDNYRSGYSGDYRQWDRNWRNNNRYNWSGYRSSNRSVYRLGAYYAPYRNYRYNRIGVGFHLDSLFYGNSYWIGNPWQYRLPAVYGPYRWVRYYDDVLLVDVYSGQVVDVIYDFFW